MLPEFDISASLQRFGTNSGSSRFKRQSAETTSGRSSRRLRPDQEAPAQRQPAHPLPQRQLQRFPVSYLHFWLSTVLFIHSFDYPYFYLSTILVIHSFSYSQFWLSTVLVIHSYGYRLFDHPQF